MAANNINANYFSVQGHAAQSNFIHQENIVSKTNLRRNSSINSTGSVTRKIPSRQFYYDLYSINKAISPLHYSSSARDSIGKTLMRFKSLELLKKIYFSLNRNANK